MPSRNASSSATKKAEAAEEQQQLLDTQGQADPQAGKTPAAEETKVAPPAEASPEMDKIAIRKQNASNTTVVLVNRYNEIQDKDGNPVGEGGIRIWGQQSTEVNYGNSDNPDYRRVEIQSTPFELWNNGTPLADSFKLLLDSNDWVLVRLYWEFSTKAADITMVDVKDKNGNPVISRKTGNPVQQPKFAYRPNKRVFAYDTVSLPDAESGNNNEIPF